MQDIYLKRNELRKNSVYLRSAKFDKRLKKEETFKLNEEQTEVYNKFNFYNEFIKAYSKEKEVKKWIIF